MKKYYVEVTNENYGCILQSRWFKTRRAAIEWAKGISYTCGRYMETDIYLMCAVFHGDQYEDIYREESIKDEVYDYVIPSCDDSALEELVNSEIGIYKKNCDKIDNDILEQNIWMTVESYYEDDRIPTKEELEYLDKLGLNFTEFAAHYEVVTLDAPNGEIRTVDSTCDLEEALKWYNEEINGFVYIQHVDHNSMLIEVLKCNF